MIKRKKRNQTKNVSKMIYVSCKSTSSNNDFHIYMNYKCLLFLIRNILVVPSILKWIWNPVGSHICAFNMVLERYPLLMHIGKSTEKKQFIC